MRSAKRTIAAALLAILLLAALVAGLFGEKHIIKSRHVGRERVVYPTGAPDDAYN